MNPLKIDKPIRLIELFAGIGSQAKALKRLGANFEHYRICEFDKYAIKSYNAVHGTNFEISDITKITAADLSIVDTDKYCYILTYSFPCQDLSLAGKGNGMAKGSGTRSGLLWEVERLLNECEELPQILLMENVTQVHGKKNNEHFCEWISFLENKGYSNYWKDLNAKNFGIPQNRNRTFMVSVLGDYRYEFPQEFPLELRLKDMLEDAVDEKFYLSDRMIATFDAHKARNVLKGNGFGWNHTDGSGVAYAIKANSNCRADDNYVEEPYVVASRGRNPENPSDRTAGIYLEQRLEPNFSGCTNTFTTVQKDNYVVEPLVWDGYNQRIRAEKGTVGTLTRNCGADLKRSGQGVIEGHRIRKLTPKECWRLMGFDDADFEKASAVNSNTQLYKQAGNSIVVNVLEEIFRKML